MNDRQRQLIENMGRGCKLIMTYQSGSFFFEDADGKLLDHYYHSEIAALRGSGLISPGTFVGQAPGGYWTFQLSLEYYVPASLTDKEHP